MAEKNGLFRHILVPTDGSESSVAAGQLAIRLAAVHKARMTFLYIIDDTVVEQVADASGRAADQVRSEMQVTGQRYVDHLQRLATEAGLTANKVVRSGIPHNEIRNLVQQQSVDLIVMGRVGRLGPRRILIGSVTERVIEYAPCPVLVAGKTP